MIFRDQLTLMKNHAIRDVSIEKGSRFETPRPTTHSNATFDVDSIIHYRVTNMPGAVPITSTYELTDATLPHALSIADNGLDNPILLDLGLRSGMNVAGGYVTHPGAADTIGVPCVEEALALQVAR